MILRVRSSLVQEVHRLATELHPLALETNITDCRRVFLALRPVVLEKEIEASGRVENGAFERDFLKFVALRELEGLCGCELRGGAEVEVVAVGVEFEC